MFEKTENLLGIDNFKLIKEKNILIIGLGGVGGITLEALVRSGISNITIIDYDVFDETNLNRQILSDTTSIGEKKVDVAHRKMKNINNELNIIKKCEFIDKNSINTLESYDYIIDACDDVEAKLEIYKFAQKNNIKLISSMGMGNRVDINKIYITRLDKTLNDPLAKKLRYLCKKEGINTKFPVVSSTEIPIKNAKISSLFCVTNTAGIHIANYIINDIIKNK